METGKRLQNILILFPMFFIACSFAWHFMFWSTFDANIIQLLSIDQMLLSFIDSFSKFFYIYTGSCTIMLYIFGYDVKITNSEKLQTDIKYRKKMAFISAMLILLPLLFCMLIFEFYQSINKWLYIVIPIIITIYFAIIDTEFLNESFSSYKQRRLVIMTLVTLFSYTICIAKFDSLRILKNIEYDIVTIKQNQDVNKSKNEYKLLGFASDYIVVSPLNNNEILLFNKSSTSLLNIKKYKIKIKEK